MGMVYEENRLRLSTMYLAKLVVIDYDAIYVCLFLVRDNDYLLSRAHKAAKE